MPSFEGLAGSKIFHNFVFELYIGVFPHAVIYHWRKAFPRFPFFFIFLAQ